MTLGPEGEGLISQEPATREIVTGSSFSERAQQLLQEKLLGIVAIQRPDGEIVQSEMWYELIDEGTILMNTAVFRKKFSHLQKNPYVSLLVSRSNYQYVTMYGPVSLNDEPEVAQEDIRRLAVRYLGSEEADKIMAEEFSREQRVSLLLKPRRITEYFSQ